MPERRRPHPSGQDMPTMVWPAPAPPHADTGRRRSSGVPAPWFLALMAVIGVLAVAVALQAALLSGSASEGRDRSAASVADQAASTPGPPATAKSSAKPSGPATAKRPADLIVDLRIMVIKLERDGQLGSDSADDLDKRLKEAFRSLAKGDIRHALESLNGVAQRIAILHEVGKLQEASFQELAETMAHLAQIMPRP